MVYQVMLGMGIYGVVNLRRGVGVLWSWEWGIEGVTVAPLILVCFFSRGAAEAQRFER